MKYFLLLLGILCLYTSSIAQKRVSVDPYLLRLRQTVDKPLPKEKQFLQDFRTQIEKVRKNRSHIRKQYEDLGVPTTEQDPIVKTIIEFEGNPASLTALNDVDAHHLWNNFYVAEFPVSQLDTLVNLPGMLGLEISKPVEPELDVSRNLIGMPQVEGSFPNITGKGIVIGFIDTGIDIDHPTFKNPDGSTRILHIWDQTDESGISPSGFPYGTEWSAADINSGRCTQRDDNGHGTHVAGIAAGNGRDSNGQQTSYKGIAPEADIIMVKIDETVTFDLIPKTLSTEFLEGMKYIAERAKVAGKPFVVNISLGTRIGPRDGSSLFERSVSEFINDESMGKGRIVVKSAGNDGVLASDPASIEEKAIHAEDDNNAIRQFVIDGPSNTTKSISLDIYYDATANYTITLRSPSGRTYGPVNFNSTNLWTTPEDGFIVIDNYDQPTLPDLFYYGAANPVAQISMTDGDFNGDGIIDGRITEGTWQLELSSGSGSWDAYIVYRAGTKAYFPDGHYSNRKVITEPGNAENVITIGSFNTKNQWQSFNGQTIGVPNLPIGYISHFSSPGPTRDGRTKPDFYAPGAVIASAKSQYATVNGNFVTTNFEYYHDIGTSFAAPHMSGAIALALQKLSENSSIDLNYPKVKYLLERSKTPEKYLDVYELLLAADYVVGIEDRVEIEMPSSDYTIVEFDQAKLFQARFLDEDPYGDYGKSYYWTVQLYHTEGYVSFGTAISSNNYTNITIASHRLEEERWTRDHNGHILGKVIVTCTDNDGVQHTDETTIGVPYRPNEPVVYKQEASSDNIELSWIGSGSDSYTLSVSDGGTNQTINLGNSTSYTITGLSSCTNYNIQLISSNQQGTTSTNFIVPTTVPYTLTRSEKTNVSGGATHPGLIEARASEKVVLKPGFHYKAVSGSQFNALITSNCPSSAQARVTMKNGKISNNIEMDSVLDSRTEERVLIFPNPTHHQLTIQYQGTSTSYKVLIYDLWGRLVVKKNVLAGQCQVDLSSYPAGLYIVEVLTKDGQRFRQKILKE